MKELTINGIDFVVLTEKPDWFPVAHKDSLYPNCQGCFFDTSDVVGLVPEHELPSKKTRPQTGTCDIPVTVNTYGGCFCIPLDYYERHKPK